METHLPGLVGLWPAVGGTTATARGCHSASSRACLVASDSDNTLCLARGVNSRAALLRHSLWCGHSLMQAAKEGLQCIQLRYGTGVAPEPSPASLQHSCYYTNYWFKAMSHIFEQLGLGPPTRVLILTHSDHHSDTIFSGTSDMLFTWSKNGKNWGQYINLTRRKVSGMEFKVQSILVCLYPYMNFTKQATGKKTCSRTQFSWQILVPEKLFRLEIFLQTQIQTAGWTENVICCVSFHHKICNHAAFSE